MSARFPLFLYVTLFFAAVSAAGAQTFNPVWQISQLNQAESYSADRKIVGTPYFYWYDYPGSHFFTNTERTGDYLQDHFPIAESVSYHSIEWHDKQLADCAEAGIDFILPVYWGIVDNYFKQGMAFSVTGLGPLQTAIERRSREGKPSPKIGMFYDTSTLRPDVRGEAGRTEKYDLRTGIGKDIFYRTIRDYFYQVHPKHWATIDGKPIVVLYNSGFAAYHDQSTIDFVYQKFPADFHGRKPYIIRDLSWNFRCDGTTEWGAALAGPRLYAHVAQIGAGYNDTAVPGQFTPIRHREDGNYYRWCWNQVLNSSARIVLLETWNEMHEGTSLCDSREYGRFYIELTKQYAARFKAGEKTDERIELQYPDVLPRPPSSEGSEYKDALSVSVTLGSSGESNGVKLNPGNADGTVTHTVLDDKECTKTITAGNTYMYFSIADPFYFDEKESLEIEYTYWDGGHAWHQLQYDSHDPTATLNGAYKNSHQTSCRNAKRWVTNTIRLSDARFVNRENGGSDLRFAVSDGWLAIQNVTVKKLSAVN